VKPHPNIRKTVKLGGLVVCVVLVTVWIGSGWFFLQRLNGRGGAIQVADGMFTVRWREESPRYYAGAPSVLLQSIPPKSFDWHWWFERNIGWIGTPIWAFILPGLGCTAFGWRLDSLARRRLRLGHCPKCNYDRTGIPAASVCPECGSAPAQAST
jgi:hypothetical protein